MTSRPGTTRPTVSVVMPVFNYARYLRDAVDSLYAQTYQHWECIIVDDGSTDDTPILLASLAIEEPRIRVMHQGNAGPAIARNTALTAVRGEFVQFLDADDLLAPDKLARHVGVMVGNPDIDLAYGPTAYFDDRQPDLLRESFRASDRDGPPRVEGSGRRMTDALLKHNVLTIEAPLIRKSVFDELGGFDRHLRRITDWEFWLRCAIAGKRFAYIPSDEPVARIRVHGASLSHDELTMRLVEIDMRQMLSATLPDGDLRVQNEHLLTELKVNTGIAIGLDGDMLAGLRLIVPAALSERRRSWILWAIAILGVPVPPVRRSLRRRRYGPELA